MDVNATLVTCANAPSCECWEKSTPDSTNRLRPLRLGSVCLPVNDSLQTFYSDSNHPVKREFAVRIAQNSPTRQLTPLFDMHFSRGQYRRSILSRSPAPSGPPACFFTRIAPAKGRNMLRRVYTPRFTPRPARKHPCTPGSTQLR